jgi:hypothetical protein
VTTASAVLALPTDGWEIFRRSLKVRDRLTHPKRAADLLVADDELTDLMQVWEWFVTGVNAILGHANRGVSTATVRRGDSGQ